ncbi:hypothetical protein IAU60_006500 [Kwoniella sp. DSM 27419]
MPKSSMKPAGSVSKTKASGKPSAAPTLYSSFLPIPVLLPSACPIPIASSSKSKTVNEVVHYLYVRPHTKSTAKAKPKPRRLGQAAVLEVDDAEDEEDQGRTLFAVNVPVDAGERDLRTIFGRWGVVESVRIGGKEVDALEQAVRGLPVEDGDDEEDTDDDSEVEEGSEDADTADQVGSGATFRGDIPVKLSKAAKRSARRKAKDALPPSVPDVTELPPLDPRSSALGLSGSHSAHITFVDAITISRVMATALKPSEAITLRKYPSESTGLEYYTALHSSLRPEMSSVKAFADSSMARFDHLHSLLLSSRAKAQGAGALVDEDGFTVVVRSGKYGRAGGRGDGMGKMGVGVAGRGFHKKDAERKKGKGVMELEGFYKFQRMDKKRQELADLRSKFESDKAKVEELKKTRRFKPY